MELFSNSGHLTDEALRALVRGQELSELDRLETAEHLAYCDRCLQRYTELLTDIPLLAPTSSCQRTLWQRIRQRTLRIFTSRYATAAAAIVLALTMLWSDVPRMIQTQLPLPEEIPSITEQWSVSLDNISSRFHTVFDRIDELTRLE
ncbi:MAG: hypothetical protein IJ396_03805 [Oscillibacter sp.]|nr:hypothetical protein [Oscillibacter sp.]